MADKLDLYNKSIEEQTQKDTHIVEVHASLRRNVEGFKMPPSASMDDLAASEKLLVSLLQKNTAAPQHTQRSCDGRSVCLSWEDGLEAIINKEDHLHLCVRQPGSDLFSSLQRLKAVRTELKAALVQAGYAFSHKHRFGFVTASPRNLGTGLRAQISVRLPSLARSRAFTSLCERLRLP